MEYLAKHWAIIVIMIVYTGFCLGIGQWFKKRAAEGVDAFYVAKREIPGWAISLAFFSTFISTNTYIGQAGFSFQAGLSWAWVGVYWVVFCMISWLLLGPRMRVQTAKLSSVTIPDYFDFRYKSTYSKAIRIFSAVIILFATLWYMTAIAKGCAHLLNSTLGMPYAWGAFLVIFITTLYSVMGGMYSVLWTDAVQGLIMFFVAILMVMIPAMYVGGWEPLMASVANTAHLTAKGPTHRKRPHDLLHAGLFCIHHQHRPCRRDEADCRTTLPDPVLLHRQREKHEVRDDCHPDLPGHFTCLCLRGRRPRPWDGYGPRSLLSHKAHG